MSFSFECSEWLCNLKSSDVFLAINHEHAQEFVATILDAPGAQAPIPSYPQTGATVPAASKEEGRRNGNEPWCKVGFFVFQDLNHGPLISALCGTLCQWHLKTRENEESGG